MSHKGIGCSTCHGRVDKMPLMWKVNTLYMQWCVECHRDPSQHVRPRSEVFNPAYTTPAPNQDENWSETCCRIQDSEPDGLRHVPQMINKYWRSFEELSQDPGGAGRSSKTNSRTGRRTGTTRGRGATLTLMGASDRILVARRRAPCSPPSRLCRTCANRKISYRASRCSTRLRSERPGRDCDWCAGRKPPGTADQDRRQPGSSG